MENNIIIICELDKPATTIPSLKGHISTFGYFSGSKVNVDKTMGMDIGNRILQAVKLQSGFEWPKDGMKYFGIQISPLLDSLYDVHYKSITKSTNKAWTDGQHFLYLCQVALRVFLWTCYLSFSNHSRCCL